MILIIVYLDVTVCSKLMTITSIGAKTQCFIVWLADVLPVSELVSLHLIHAFSVESVHQWLVCPTIKAVAVVTVFRMSQHLNMKEATDYMIRIHMPDMEKAVGKEYSNPSLDENTVTIRWFRSKLLQLR